MGKSTLIFYTALHSNSVMLISLGFNSLPLQIVGH